MRSSQKLAQRLSRLHLDDLRPARAELTEVAALTGPSARPLLTEVNVLPVMTGERPYLMDCYSFRVIAQKRPDYAENLWEALRARYPGAPGDAREASRAGGGPGRVLPDGRTRGDRLGSKTFHGPA